MTRQSKQKPVDVDRSEHVVFEKGSVTASIQYAVTRDPQLPDGPYRTLHLYTEYARNKDTPSVREAAEARGKSTRTLFKHRQTLVALAYLKIIRNDDGEATLTLCNPARIPRLKEHAASLLMTGREPGTANPRPAPEDEAALLKKLRRIRSDFHAAGGRKLLRAYHGETPLGPLLDQWVANRRYIPANWRVGMVYREIEAGNPPPASPLQSDPEMAAAFAAGARRAAELSGE